MSTLDVSVDVKSAQFYVAPTDSVVLGFIEQVMGRMLKLGYQVNAVVVSGLARPRMIIGDAIYAGIEAIESFVQALELMLKAALAS